MFALMLAVIAGVVYLLRRETPRQVIISTPQAGTTDNTLAPPSRIMVQVQGAVNRPGSYPMQGNDRVADALQRAGGVQPDADLSRFDLTMQLTDGVTLIVPTRANENAPATNLTPPVVAEPGKLNLNIATLQELDALPGIGPVLAQRILDYRTANGNFKSIEELKQVRGIGDALYRDIQAMVTIQ